MARPEARIKSQKAAAGANGRNSPWLAALARQCLDNFLANDDLIAASALSYATIVSLVPLAAIVLAIFSGFEMFSAARDRFLALVLADMAPDLGVQAATWFQSMATSAAKTTAIGGGALIVTSVLLLATIEDRLQHIWHISTPRPWQQRVLAYWMILTLGPILIGIGFSLPDYVDMLAERAGVGAVSDAVTGTRWYSLLARGAALAVEIASFAMLYRFIPNCDVRWRESIVAALFAGLAIEGLKLGFAVFVSRVASYGAVYGALAGIPIFLLWMYIFWAVVLAGAELAAGLRQRRLKGDGNAGGG